MSVTQRTASTVLEAQQNGQSFRQALKDAWDQQPPIMEQARSPETMNYFGMVGYVLSMSVCFCSTMFYLIPAICSAEDTSHMGLFLRLLIFLNVSVANLNWMLCAERKSQMLKDETIPAEMRQKLAAASYLPLGYRYCAKCQLYSPPRAYHCHLCHTCVLKRDYHCYVTGSCVGFTSQRRYLPFLFHVTIGGLINGALAGYYLNTRLPILSEYITYVPFVAIARCFTDDGVTLADLWVMAQMYACLSVMVVTGFYLTWEWLMVVRGQTSYEATRSIQTYRMGVFKNIYLVFGPVWFLNFIFPLPTTIPSDGVNWERKSQQKGN